MFAMFTETFENCFAKCSLYKSSDMPVKLFSIKFILFVNVAIGNKPFGFGVLINLFFFKIVFVTNEPNIKQLCFLIAFTDLTKKTDWKLEYKTKNHITESLFDQNASGNFCYRPNTVLAKWCASYASKSVNDQGSKNMWLLEFLQKKHKITFILTSTFLFFL